MEELRVLADVEADLVALRRSLAPYLERKKGLAARIADADRRIGEAERAEAETRTEMRRLEAELADLESRLAEERRKIEFVASMRAAQAAEAELTGMTARRGALEETVLEAMESHEKAAADLASARREGAPLRAELAELETALREAEDAARVKSESLVAKRTEIIERLPADIARKVRSLVSREVVPSAAVVEAEYCPACKAVFKANALSHLRAGQHTFCDQCGRVLVSL